MSRQAVFDCNVFLQAMLRSTGAAHACWQKVVAGEVQLYVTTFIIAEIRKLPEHRRIRRKFRQLTADRVLRFIEEISEEISDYAILVDDPPIVLEYSRDPADAHYVNVALQTGALLVVSNDKDLLDLMRDSNSEGLSLRKSYPGFHVLTPSEFIVLPAH